MKRIICLCTSVALCAALSACDNIDIPLNTPETSEVTVNTPESEDVTIKTREDILNPEETTEITTEETTEITTEETTETTTEETTEITTEATTEETTEATTEPAAPQIDPNSQVLNNGFAKSVLDGEYTYGGEPIIEEIDGFTYVNGILIANKTYTLPYTYDPGALSPDALSAFYDMQAAAQNDGIYLKIISGYRSYSTQNNTYNKYVARDGVAEADRYSARPGHSEHQTGLAMDINSLYQSFGETAEGIWLADHCAEYGFIIRYPYEKEHITGYMYEPWHVRYVGVDLAKTITESGLCLEEFLGITSVYSE